jgi:glyoxylase-like metal-dependent hydrolase (beta-lactamase superfamily II)
MLVVRHAVVGPFGMNAWLVACDRTGEAALVDPGDEIPKVLELAAPEGFRVGRIVLTHGHLDHAAFAGEAAAATGAPVQIHAADQALLDRLPWQHAMFGLPPPPPAPAIAHHHAHGETFRVGDHEATILHVPGHSPGSCAIHFAAGRRLFAGDTLFAGSIGRTDLPGGDGRAIVRSIREVLFPLGDDVVVHSGHGPDTTLGEERRENPFVGDRAF